MKTAVALKIAALVLFIALTMTQAARACTLDEATGTTIDQTPFITNAYNLRWNAANNLIAFMQPDEAGYYRVFTMRPDKSGMAPLMADHPGLPPKHQGAVYWHPSGKYLLFTAEKTAWTGHKLFGVPDYESLPGFGLHDDLWLAEIGGNKSWKLTDDPNTKDQGILIPVFSPDGKRIAWAARQPGGKYALTVADFAETPKPHLSNIRTYLPGGLAYYEPGSFTSDGKGLIYTSDQDTHSFWSSQIYRLDFTTGKGTRLTQGKDYNEHPTVVNTPGGDWVVYMSTKGVERFRFSLMLGTDWWAMKTDGSGAKRLTTMNKRNSPEDSGKAMVAGTVAVSPAGDFMLGDAQDSIIKQTGLSKIVRFTCP